MAVIPSDTLTLIIIIIAFIRFMRLSTSRTNYKS